ncbi:hypothetical protein JMM61_17575 [Rhodovulum sulfidophilum]|uniref:hypothetical protein n=1 Tax=Rhodovulum sulfidophilum TaxID=35806 RepID=UPI001928BFD8|nr:hypothetical protein [Rhodovulum sulfidophilum]MBL3587169.1 hypothetical protein [Rhodovulum sulfidophilum]
MLHSDKLSASIATRTRIGPRDFSPISAYDATTLQAAQRSDASSLAHSALASFIEATQGVSYDRHTWAIVKYYYSAFYACRALMLMRGVSIFYVGRSPFSLLSRAGCSISREGGNSHSLTFEKFSQQFSADPLLSQDINGLPPLDWLEENRNIASYKAAPFLDPAPNALFSKPAAKLRKHLATYLTCDLSLYVFDPDHSMISYPLKLIIKLNDEIQRLGLIKVQMANHYVTMLGSVNCFMPEFPMTLTAYDFK